MALPFERRDFERIRTDKFTVEYRVISDDHTVLADVINVSGGGICFLRNVPIKKGDVIQVLFPFKTKKVVLKAQVMRLEGREVGLKFIDEEKKVDEFVEIFNREYKIVKSETEMREEREKNLFSHREGDIDDILDKL